MPTATELDLREPDAFTRAPLSHAFTLQLHSASLATARSCTVEQQYLEIGKPINGVQLDLIQV